MAAMEESGLLLAESPNDTLAVEYLRQLEKLAQSIRPIAVQRQGSGYNASTLETDFASASSIRSTAMSGSVGGIQSHVPSKVFSDLSALIDDGSFPASLDALSPAVLYTLRSIGARQIARLADVSEGLENPIYRAALASSNCTELLERIKTKRYTLARLKRILVNALLATTSELQTLAFEDEKSLYIRVLGVRKECMHLLSELASNSTLPVITSASDAAKLPKNASDILEHTRRASLVRALACPTKHDVSDDFSHRLIVV